ncbi:unnamed protein product [Brachionus calyciflorus]|uniref:Uncharacterized protein n=1 Tax=Brachionus calyciflorus TaxID=104777 RepID=A0A813TAT1_9BILA|nr:unnamed protein product [Brachionus calyciflorus]
MECTQEQIDNLKRAEVYNKKHVKQEILNISTSHHEVKRLSNNEKTLQSNVLQSRLNPNNKTNEIKYKAESRSNVNTEITIEIANKVEINSNDEDCLKSCQKMIEIDTSNIQWCSNFCILRKFT